MATSNQGEKRPWKGVIFSCCNAYGRLYQNPNNKRWNGNCPKCFKPVSMMRPDLGK